MVDLAEQSIRFPGQSIHMSIYSRVVISSFRQYPLLLTMLLLSSASLTISSLLKEMDSLNEKPTIIQIIVYCAIASASSFVIATCILIYRIVFPTIRTYPWSKPPEDSPSRKREKTLTVVFAGSFNPPHWGHLVMIRYLSDR